MFPPPPSSRTAGRAPTGHPWRQKLTHLCEPLHFGDGAPWECGSFLPLWGSQFSQWDFRKPVKPPARQGEGSCPQGHQHDGERCKNKIAQFCCFTGEHRRRVLVQELFPRALRFTKAKGKHKAWALRAVETSRPCRCQQASAGLAPAPSPSGPAAKCWQPRPPNVAPPQCHSPVTAREFCERSCFLLKQQWWL